MALSSLFLFRYFSFTREAVLIEALRPLTDVADYVLDRISPSVKPETPVQKLLVKEEALQLFLNGYARQVRFSLSLSRVSR